MESSPIFTAKPLTRREAIGRILATAAVATAVNRLGFAAELEGPGLSWDPNLLKKEIPWPRLLTEAEKRTLTVLGDILIPADEFGPAASAVGVPDFIDEWVSAPYENQRKDRKTIREGLVWLDGVAQARGGKAFAESTAEVQTQILKDITTEGTPERKAGRTFFLCVRDRMAGGYFTTPEGWKALGYVGNVPSQDFAGPPPEVLQQIGVA